MHTKHCSSDHNTSRDLECDKNVPRLVTRGATNLKKKQSEGNTLLCYEYLFYINTQVQMLKSFNSLLIQKFTVSAQGTSYQNFPPAHCTWVNFFGTMVLIVQGFFSYAYSLAGYFFSKITHPMWLALISCYSPVSIEACSNNLSQWKTSFNNQLKSFSEVPFFGESIVRVNCEN